MNLQDFIKYPALSYSSLSNFADPETIYGQIIKRPFKDSDATIKGKLFEQYLQDFCTVGIKDRYFTAPELKATSATMPIYTNLLNGVKIDNSFLEYNADRKTLNGKKKAYNDFVQLCIDNPGKLPIPANIDFVKMRDAVLGCFIQGQSAADLLFKSEWQKPLIWTDLFGIDKKALYDILTIDYGLSIDLKTAGSIKQFNQFFRSKYWIQDIHYTEGTTEIMPEMDIKRVDFLVVTTKEPYIANTYSIHPESRDYMQDRYDSYCVDYQKWNEGGRKISYSGLGETLKIYG